MRLFSKVLTVTLGRSPRAAATALSAMPPARSVCSDARPCNAPMPLQCQASIHMASQAARHLLHAVCCGKGMQVANWHNVLELANPGKNGCQQLWQERLVDSSSNLDSIIDKTGLHAAGFNPCADLDVKCLQCSRLRVLSCCRDAAMCSAAASVSRSQALTVRCSRLPAAAPLHRAHMPLSVMRSQSLRTSVCASTAASCFESA